ncbi:hypothetical protein PENTCL1PPCAC_28805, partial [Pristionchus entomophagus]
VRCYRVRGSHRTIDYRRDQRSLKIFNFSFEGEKTALRTFVQAWKDAGAIAIGGCCRIGTDEMKQIKQVVDDINNKSGQIPLSETVPYHNHAF